MCKRQFDKRTCASMNKKHQWLLVQSEIAGDISLTEYVQTTAYQEYLKIGL